MREKEVCEKKDRTKKVLRGKQIFTEIRLLLILKVPNCLSV